MNLNCLIVDDEPLSQDVIIDFVNASPELNLVAVCSNALEANSYLKNQKIDILFLDINMPKLSGISFVKSLKAPPSIVFITAYPEYAVEGFEVDAVDYLLKPVSFERFRTAVNRLLERLSENNDTKNRTHLMVRANKKNYRINFDELLYLEAQGDYVRFVTTEKSLMVHGTLKEFLTQIPDNLFVQIHKSYAISLSKIIYTEGYQVKIADYKLPISLSYKNELLEKIKL
jgi:DNA-binding LytR/AlgR family response regulator